MKNTKDQKHKKLQKYQVEVLREGKNSKIDEHCVEPQTMAIKKSVSC